MFDMGFSELMLVGLIALLVLGPERLPKVARTVGYWGGRARSYMRQMTTELEREVQQSEIRETIQKTRDTLNATVDLGTSTPSTEAKASTAEPDKPGTTAPPPESASAEAEEEDDSKVTLSAWERAEMEMNGTGPKLGEDLPMDLGGVEQEPLAANAAATEEQPVEQESSAQEQEPTMEDGPSKPEKPAPKANG